MTVMRGGEVAILLLILAGCSRASLLGGPGPEAAYHEVPASTERLAVLEAKRRFDSKAECRTHLAAMTGSADLVELSAKEVRAYRSEGGVHHEYSCADRQLFERSWRSDGETAHDGIRSDPPNDAPH